MFSHVVIFWTKPDVLGAADSLLAGAQKYLATIPGIRSFQVGKMVPSARPVVERSYQVALNILFDNKAAMDAYQSHPLHLEFVEKAFKPNCSKCVVFDFA